MYIRTSVGKLSKFRVEAEGGKKDIPTFSHVKAKRTQRVVFKSASAYMCSSLPVRIYVRIHLSVYSRFPVILDFFHIVPVTSTR